MRLDRFFAFFRSLNFATLREFLERQRQQQEPGQPVQFAYNLILALLNGLLALGSGLVKGVVGFFRFFIYLKLGTLREVFDRASKQRLTGLAAEMAYNAMLALFPAILAVLAAIGLFESLQSTLYQLARLLAEVVPDEVRSTIGSLIEEIIRTRRNKEVFSFGFIGAIWAFSGVISAAMAALDQIHQIPYDRARPFWKAKLISIGLTLGTIILLIVASLLVFISDLIVRLVARRTCLLDLGQSCLLDSGLSCLLQPIDSCQLEGQLLKVWHLWTWPITLGIVSAAFAFVYCYGPSQRHCKTPLMPGAVLAAVLWAGISSGFRLYVSHFGNYNRTYGAVGTIIILLLWLYLSSLAALLGAQLNVTVGEAMHRSHLKASAIEASKGLNQ